MGRNIKKAARTMKTTTLLTLGASLALAATSSAATIFSEDFDALTAASALNGQGGWTGPGGIQVVADPGSFGFSGNIAQNTGVDNQLAHSLSGFNDTNIATIEFDLRISGDSTFTGGTLGTSGTGFLVNRGNMNLYGSASAGAFDHNFSGDHVYHMVMTIDPTAFSGAGSASLTFAEYTAESTLAAAVTVFANEELTLDDPGKALSDSNSFVIREHNDGPAPARVDNILVTQVPEPSSAALLGLGGLALFLRRRK